jgi:putative spermidine/putrescine transport system substrate-binding protein
MVKVKTFAEHRSEKLIADYKEGRLSRRDFLFAASVLGIAPSIATSRLGHAQGLELVLAGNWGGDQLKSVNETWVKTYQQKTGNKMSVDGSNPSNPKIRAMVESKHVIWDIIDAGTAAMSELGPRGQLEEIDYNIVDRDQLLPGFDFKHGIANYLFAVVLVWNTKLVSGRPTIQDFYDLKKYPGKRTMRKSAIPQMELALLGDGVPRDQIYPMDRARALKKLASVKDDVIFWETGSQSESLLRDGECAMGLLWYDRAVVLKRQSKGQIDFTFENGILQQGAWVVPVGNKAGKKASMIAMAAFQDPQCQVDFFKLQNNGPANPKANALVPPDLQAINPGSPENLAVMVKIGTNWYLQGDNFRVGQQAFLDLFSS